MRVIPLQEGAGNLSGITYNGREVITTADCLGKVTSDALLRVRKCRVMRETAAWQNKGCCSSDVRDETQHRLFLDGF